MALASGFSKEPLLINRFHRRVHLTTFGIFFRIDKSSPLSLLCRPSEPVGKLVEETTKKFGGLLIWSTLSAGATLVTEINVESVGSERDGQRGT